MNTNRLVLFIFSCLFCVSYMFGNEHINILEPKNNTVFDKNDNILFSWNTISLGNTYNIQVSTDLSFSNIIFDSTINQTNLSKKFDIVSELYWRIRTIGNNYSTNWTSGFNFKTIDINTIGNLLLRYSAQDSTPAIGSFLTNWKDLSGNSNDAIQPANNLQPTVMDGGALIGHKKVINFDGLTNGNGDFMSFNLLSTIRTIFIVARHNASMPYSDFRCILGDDFPRYDFHGNSGSGLFLPGASSNNIISGQGYVNKVLSRVDTIKKYTQHTLYSFVTLGDVNASRISKDRVADRVWAGDYGDIMLFSNALDFDTKELVENYIINKYTKPVAIPDVMAGTSFCTNINITAPDNYVSYLWSTGSTAPTITVTPNNTYTLTTKDVFGRESSTSFNVYPYRRLNNATVYLCQGDTFKLNLNTPAGFTALWNTGATTTNLIITQPGQYIVKINDNANCFVFDTINVIIDNPSFLPTPDLNDSIRMCMNEKLFIQTPTSFDSIQWSNGTNDNFITVSTPGNYTVYARTTTGCVLNKTIKIKINGTAPTANFSNTVFCEQAATNFTDISTTVNGAVVNNWKWSFGDNNTSTQQNPTNTYTNVGSYNVGFKVATNEGCSDSISRTVVVNKRPKASFYNLLSCSGLPTTFVDQSLANAATLSNWQWDFNGLGNSNLIQNPSFQFPSAGIYNVKLKVTNSNGCEDTITNAISVKPSPVANFSFDEACGTNAVNFQFLGTVIPPSTITSHQWDFGDGTIQSSIRNYSKSYQAPGIYPVKLTVRSSDQCSNTIEKQVKVYDFPIVDFDVSPTQCVGKEIQFSDISYTPDGTPITSRNWYFAGQGTSTQQNSSHTFNQQGNYTVQLTAKNSAGCTATKLRSIAVTEAPIPAFTFSPQNGLPPLTVSYFNQSPTNGNYIWDFGDGSATYSGYSPPVHVYNAIGTYPIKLTATNFRGCTDTLVKYILVDRALIDAVLTSVTITPVDDYYQVQITVVNNSNIQITNLDLGIQIGSGTQIIESWTGSLLPGATLTYIFTGKIKLSDNAVPLVCATVESVNNGAQEERVDNNSSCKEVAVGNFDILNIFPNPAYDNINIGVMLPRDGKVTIKFIDMLGKILYSADYNGVRGYNKFTMTTMPLNAAVYVAEVSYDGQIIREKFMRKDRK